jgi:hypothetical protein
MFTEGQKKTLTSGEALATRRRIKFSASTAVYADAGESANGVTEFAVADATPVACRLVNGPGTFEMTAAGAIAAGAIIFGAADGKVSLAPSGQPIGIAIEAATADGDQIECILGDVTDYPTFAGKTFEVVSANKTLDIQDNGKVIVVDTDGVVITLPATVDGMEFVVMNGGSAVGAAGISISPNSADLIAGPDIAGTDNKDQINTKATAVPGDYEALSGGNASGFVITAMRGTWAEEA